MMDHAMNDALLDMYLFETGQFIEQLEQLVIAGERNDGFDPSAINDIFRIMHTIKGSSAMMGYANLAALAHAIEDVFGYLRSERPNHPDFSALSDLLLESIDFVKAEIRKAAIKLPLDGNADTMTGRLQQFLLRLQQPQHGLYQTVPQLQHYEATLFFEDGCEMENIRAYNVIHQLGVIAADCFYTPSDILENSDSVRIIREQGFRIIFRTQLCLEELKSHFAATPFLCKLDLRIVEPEAKASGGPAQGGADSNQPAAGLIQVNVSKLDQLMDLVGELVIAEAMVTQNPDLAGLEMESFQKAARHLRKIAKELQSAVMSVRMVPLTATFRKMNRIVRDMGKKLDKEIRLQIVGEETEVDKTIIERISDPLMHLVRNAIDHGIESKEERAARGKAPGGLVTLEAKHAGSDVLISVRDDGKGLSREKLLRKAQEKGILMRSAEDMTDKDIYSLIFHPGFSTKEQISEFSGRGVGMDVVAKNIEAVGGSVSIDSAEDKGTAVTIKIPLTLAIIDGMNVRVGASRYTIPTAAIKQSFRPQESDLIEDPDGNEMIMLRGQCLPILRLHRHFKANAEVEKLAEGIIVLVEEKEQMLCLFADELLGEQQVVVKPLPVYIKRSIRIGGLAGCTLLGDGNISLILDIEGVLRDFRQGVHSS